MHKNYAEHHARI